ncbi:MAG: hypothetical protein ACK50Y_07360 [Flavobacteriia bacterium]
MNLLQHLSFNGQKVEYLLHGQVFKLNYVFSRTLFVVVKYNNGTSFFRRFYVKKASGTFENVTNAYSPQIIFFAFGWSIKRYKQQFKINFLNTIVREMRPRQLSSNVTQRMDVNAKNVYLNQIAFSVESTKVQPNLITTFTSVDLDTNYLSFKTAANAKSELSE